MEIEVLTLKVVNLTHQRDLFQDANARLEAEVAALRQAEPGDPVWRTTETKDGSRKLAEPFYVHNPHYIAVHNEWKWEQVAPLRPVAAPAASVQAMWQALEKLAQTWDGVIWEEGDDIGATIRHDFALYAKEFGAAPAAQQPAGGGWISVADEHPLHFAPVWYAILFTYMNASPRYSVGRGYYDGGEWRDIGDRAIQAPTHWMSADVPEPPALPAAPTQAEG